MFAAPPLGSSSLSFGFLVSVLLLSSSRGLSSLSGSYLVGSISSSSSGLSEAMPLAELCLYHVRPRRTVFVLY